MLDKEQKQRDRWGVHTGVKEGYEEFYKRILVCSFQLGLSEIQTNHSGDWGSCRKPRGLPSMEWETGKESMDAKKSKEILEGKEPGKPSPNPVYPHLWPLKSMLRNRLHTVQKQKNWTETRTSAQETILQSQPTYEFYLFREISVLKMFCRLRQGIPAALGITLLSQFPLSFKLHFPRGFIGHWSRDFKHMCIIKLVFSLIPHR